MKFGKVVENLDLKKIENVYYKKVDDYYGTVLIDQNDESKYIATIFVLANSIKSDEMKILQTSSLADVASYTYLLENDCIALTLYYQSLNEKVLETYQTALDILINKFIGLNIAMRATCPICGQSSEYNIYRGIVIPIHLDCKKDDHNDNILIHKSKKDYKLILSLLYCFVGITIACIPPIVSIFSLNLGLVFLYVLIPICGIMGYNFGGAPRYKLIILIVGIISLLLCVGMELIYWNQFSVLNEITLKEAISKNISDFMWGIVTAVSLTVLSIFASWVFLYRSRQN